MIQLVDDILVINLASMKQFILVDSVHWCILLAVCFFTVLYMGRRIK